MAKLHTTPEVRRMEGPLTKLARAISRNHKVSVRFTGTRCETNGNTILLPYNADRLGPDMTRLIHGNLDHETAHVTEEMEAKAAKRPGPLAIMNGERNPTVRMLFNAFEDIRIETKASAEYPGVAENLAFVNERSVDIFHQRHGKGGPKNFWHLFGCAIIGSVRGFDITWCPDPVLAWMPLVAAEIEAAKTASDANAVMALARSTYAKVRDAAADMKEEGEPEADAEEDGSDEEKLVIHHDKDEDDDSPEPEPKEKDNDIHMDLREDKPKTKPKAEPKDEDDEGAGYDAVNEPELEPEDEDDDDFDHNEDIAANERSVHEDERPEDGDDGEGDDSGDGDGDAGGESDDEGDESGGTPSAGDAPDDDETMRDAADRSDESDDTGDGGEGSGGDDDSGDGDPLEGKGDIGDDSDGASEDASEDGATEHNEETPHSGSEDVGSAGDDTSEGKGDEDGVQMDDVDLEEFDPREHEAEEDDLVNATRKEIEDSAKEDMSHGRYIPHPECQALDRWYKPNEGQIGNAKLLADYQAGLDGVREQVGALRSRLLSAVRVMSVSRTIGDQSSGRLDSASLHSLRTGNTRVFSSTVEGQTLDTAVSILLDLSGSMGTRYKGTKSWYAHRMAIVLAETFDKLGVPCEIIGFHNNHDRYPDSVDGYDDDQEYQAREPFDFLIFKEHDEPLRKCRERFAAINGYQDNADGEAVRAVGRRLAWRPEARKMMFVVSDGMPAAVGCDFALLNQDLFDAVGELTKAGIDVFGIGVQTSAVERFYNERNRSAHIVVNDLSTLATDIYKVVRAKLMRRAA